VRHHRRGWRWRGAVPSVVSTFHRHPQSYLVPYANATVTGFRSRHRLIVVRLQYEPLSILWLWFCCFVGHTVVRERYEKTRGWLEQLVLAFGLSQVSNRRLRSMMGGPVPSCCNSGPEPTVISSRSFTTTTTTKIFLMSSKSAKSLYGGVWHRN
jgi:hypothetical protein